MRAKVFWNRGNQTVLLNPILSDATCDKASDSIGTVTFTIDKERLNDIKFEIGDIIIIPYLHDASKVLFRGKIFKISQENKDSLEITAYDILKYFQGTKYNVFPTIDLGSIVKVMCADLAVSYGYLEKTPNVPAKLYTDKAYGDILTEYQDYLLYMNGEKFVHRVENGVIALRNLKNLMTDYIITDQIVTDYSYTESAEDVINVFEVTSKNSKTGEYTRYVVGDKASMDKLGVLVDSEAADDDATWEQIVAKAKNQLFINKQYKYDLSFTIPEIAQFNIFDIIRTKIDNQVNMGYINSISWDLINEETEISIVILGQ